MVVIDKARDWAMFLVLAGIFAVALGGLVERRDRIADNERSIRCMRATIALILDELVREEKRPLVEDLKMRLLVPRDCPALERLRNGG